MWGGGIFNKIKKKILKNIGARKYQSEGVWQKKKGSLLFSFHPSGSQMEGPHWRHGTCMLTRYLETNIIDYSLIEVL